MAEALLTRSTPKRPPAGKRTNSPVSQNQNSSTASSSSSANDLTGAYPPYALLSNSPMRGSGRCCPTWQRS